MASFLGVRKCSEGMVDAMKADALPQNPDLADVASKVQGGKILVDGKVPCM